MQNRWHYGGCGCVNLMIKEKPMFDKIDNMARIEREIEKRMEADYE